MTSAVKILWEDCSFARIHCDRGIIMELHEEYSFEVPNSRFHPARIAGRWDGWIRLVHYDGKVPVGLVPMVMKYLVGSNRTVRLSPEFKVFKETIHFDWESLKLPNEMWEHQKDIVRHALEKKRQVILSPTSSGKSLSIYATARALAANDIKTLIVVPSLMLVGQLVSDFSDYSANVDWDVVDEVHVIADGSSKDTDKNIVIATWQSLQYIKDKSWFHQWQSIIVDEVHGAKATELKNIVDNSINAFYRIGLTGTLDGTQTTEMALVGMFGPVKRVATTKELQEKGIISPVSIKSVVLKYDGDTNKYFDGKVVDKKRIRPTYQEEIDFIQRHEGRNRFICDLAKNSKGNTLILVSKVEDHGKPLYDMMVPHCPGKEVYLIHGKVDKDDRERIRKLAETKDDIVIIATYQLFATGVSIKRLHNIVFASPSKSVIRVLQSIGRVLRLHASKLCANVIDLADDFRGDKKHQNYAIKHYLERVKIYQSEKFDFEIFERRIK